MEYRAKSSKGLVQQGWKDSHDSVFHRDGTLAEPPIALCEVQAYVFAAMRAAARIAARIGQSELAKKLSAKAKGIQEEFERQFWDEDLNCYVLALDGQKRPVLDSNFQCRPVPGLRDCQSRACPETCKHSAWRRTFFLRLGHSHLR